MEFSVNSTRALKSSLQGDFSPMKTITQQGFFDELVYSTNNTSSDDFVDLSVDCYFDFSNGELKESSEEKDDKEEEKQRDSVLDNDENSNSTTLSGPENSDSFTAGELSVPTDDIADLEWVSQFVDDSVPEFQYPLLYPFGKQKTESHTTIKFEPKQRRAICVSPLFPLRVPAKTRTKRPRTAFSRAWSMGSVPTAYISRDITTEPSEKPRLTWVNQFQRRCSHCQVEKTPQWRTGPLGNKTLCNACGVRYKSGRLFPEYRPACSPTFSGKVHSNSHRKVLEMRKRKDMD